MERELAPQIAIAVPGEILLQEFLRPMNIAIEAFADQIGRDRYLIDGFVKGENRLEPDVLISIDRALGLSDGYRSNVQAQHDNHMATTRSEQRGDARCEGTPKNRFATTEETKTDWLEVAQRHRPHPFSRQSSRQ